MPITKIKEKVLKRKAPTESEREKIDHVSDDLLNLLERELDLEAKPMVVGSVSKGTYLKDPDIDIFVRYPLSFSRDEMEEHILKVGKKLLKDTKEKYAEHPYIYGTYKDYEVDIVPCYDIKDISKMKSSVDRTPFHTEYIKENMSEEKKREVMILKAFLKGINAYGAESKVWGFSGYLCELLIIHHDSFENLLKRAKDWRTGERIEIIETKKEFNDPLTVIDPVDPDRNVASPLSIDKFALFVLSSKRFLENPDLKFFFPRELEPESKDHLDDMIKKRGSDFTGFKVPKPDIVEDNLHPQVQKCIRKLVHQLSHHDFNIIHSDYFVEEDHILFLIETETNHLPKIEKHRGPPVWIKNSEDFIEKHGTKVYLEGDRLWVDKERKYQDLKEAFTGLSERIDLGSDLNKFFPDDCEILHKEDMIEEEDLALTKFLNRRFPWEL